MLSLIEKTYFDNFHHINWGMDYLDNRINPKMNNIMAIDHATRDWIDDTDYLLARKSTQYPCVSSKYTQKNEQKPWGDQRDPIFIEPFLDENQVRLSEGRTYEKGVWYFTGYPQTDHHDMAGMPNIWRSVQLLFGLEYRPTFWINIYNRVRLLEFVEVQDANVEKTSELAIIRNLSKSKIDSEFILTDNQEQMNDEKFEDGSDESDLELNLINDL